MGLIAASRINAILNMIFELCEPLLADGQRFQACMRANRDGTPRIDIIPRDGSDLEALYGDNEFIVVLDDRDLRWYRSGELRRQDLFQLVKEALFGLGLY